MSSADKTEHQNSVREKIKDGAALNLPYIIMNILATIVASYGLLADSAAVVIGAMVIAVLLGPITGIGLALVDGDRRLLFKALAAEVVGALIVLTTAFIIGSIHRDLPLGKEIMSRTAPSILDLMVAIAGGAAGAYATSSPKLVTGLIGVAIATALVPPLSTCAILLARGEFYLGFNGFLLFFTNFVAIQFMSSLVLWLEGFGKIGRRDDAKGNWGVFIKRNSVSFILLVTLGIIFGINFSTLIADQVFESNVRQTVIEGLKQHQGAYLADMQLSDKDGRKKVTVAVRTPTTITPKEVAELESKLPPFQGKVPILHIRSIPVIEANKDGYVYESTASE